MEGIAVSYTRQASCERAYLAPPLRRFDSVPGGPEDPAKAPQGRRLHMAYSLVPKLHLGTHLNGKLYFPDPMQECAGLADSR